MKPDLELIENERVTGIRRCNECNTEKALYDGFHAKANARHGRSLQCKECVRAKQRGNAHLRDLEKLRAKRKRYDETRHNPELRDARKQVRDEAKQAREAARAERKASRITAKRRHGELTAERLRELFVYDPDTGHWTRRHSVSNSPAGKELLKPYGSGYQYLAVDRRRYRSHRLAFLYMLGRWPTDLVDHADMDPTNNRWSNLRECTKAQNAANTKFNRPLRGVYPYRDKWQARIRKECRRLTIGTFDCPAAAFFAYVVEAHKTHGEFARFALPQPPSQGGR